MALHIILLILLFIVIGYSIYRKRKTFQSINRLLDCVLSQEPIALSDTKEGELSALVSKINRIQQVLGKQIMQAEDEKEQVKSLVSNMSHQLKTPLANLSLYTEILSIPQLTEEKKADAAQKLKRQVDKLDWIIGSLAKMVKLEQNAITFDIEPLPIRGTILDAIDTVYEKAEKSIFLSPPSLMTTYYCTITGSGRLRYLQICWKMPSSIRPPAALFRSASIHMKYIQKSCSQTTGAASAGRKSPAYSNGFTEVRKPNKPKAPA